MAVGGYNHIFVVIDKFTKWIEVKLVTATTAAKAAEFIEEISHRFGVPNRIIINLCTSFTGSEFRDYCQESCIDIYYASVAHPRCNGQVERANGLILLGLDPHKEKPGYWLLAILHGVRF
jgi:IS30 family transposase